MGMEICVRRGNSCDMHWFNLEVTYEMIILFVIPKCEIFMKLQTQTFGHEHQKIPNVLSDLI